jgi:hypothetical protein
MLQKVSTSFTHLKSGDTEFKGERLRHFFLYRDPGIADETHGKAIARLPGNEKGTSSCPSGHSRRIPVRPRSRSTPPRQAYTRACAKAETMPNMCGTVQ